MSIIDDQSGVGFLLETLKHNGVACASVKDGHVILLSKTTMHALLKQIEESNKDHAIIFIKKDNQERGEQN